MQVIDFVFFRESIFDDKRLCAEFLREYLYNKAGIGIFDPVEHNSFAAG